MIDPNSLKVTELKAELTARGLPTKGLKKELVTRLEEALAAEGTTDAPADSTTNPDVAPKEPQDDEDIKDDNETADKKPEEPKSTESSTMEAEDIAKVVEPTATTPTVDPVDPDIVMALVPPIPAVAERVATGTSIALEPVVGTPNLVQEGLVDTTLGSSTDIPASDISTDADNEPSKKRPLEVDVPTTDGIAKADETSSKKAKTDETNTLENDKIATATKESMESSERRRSAAPSPSPALGPSNSISQDSLTSHENKETPISSTSSPTGTRPSAAGRKLDMRSLMERQIKLAAMDRQPDVNNKPVAESPTVPKDIAAKVSEPSGVDVTPTVDQQPSGITRALSITNFVRPLTVTQVTRMLSEFGDIEVLWMDSIRTHCYVTFKDEASAEKAYSQVKGQIFPKETGKPLEPHFITPEAAAASIEAAEEALKNGKRPVIYTGAEPLVVTPKRGASISIRNDDLEVVFKHDNTEQAQVIQPAELFKITKTQPALYYKPAKEPPTIAAEARQERSDEDVELPLSQTTATESK
ncbi:hypothetical protein BGZ49_009268 [Haplosporangium sp. Z 27]|nr:hypothetical protein BGZ49_009268 [Haplosporangium sp. Z 27]